MKTYDLIEERKKTNDNADDPCRDYDEDCHDFDSKACVNCWLYQPHLGICVMLKQTQTIIKDT